jgi:hypothetical protein
MTDSPAGSPVFGKTPPVQGGVKADTPRDTVTDPQTPPEDPFGLARGLRAEAEALEKAALTDEYTRLKVLPPHSQFSYGGVDVRSDWTAVHRSLVPGVLSAAAGTGVVTITQEGE